MALKHIARNTKDHMRLSNISQETLSVTCDSQIYHRKHKGPRETVIHIIGNTKSHMLLSNILQESLRATGNCQNRQIKTQRKNKIQSNPFFKKNKYSGIQRKQFEWIINYIDKQLKNYNTNTKMYSPWILSLLNTATECHYFCWKKLIDFIDN